jgi:hypothetical protein
VATGKSSTKQVPKVASRFFSAPSPCWLRNCEWKWSHCRLWNHERNQYQSWHVDWSPLTTPGD